jgi:hypothetical protein
MFKIGMIILMKCTKNEHLIGKKRIILSHFQYKFCDLKILFI